ncbi:PREDICTED: uncharacterized protein LOC104023607 [Nipponia nippon]|uniref:uncharacterized protein LOC104023607 n=1 Tax=Nipponia nippon TaxID=128390 RepID=UPI000510A3F7|nr:PREDICTED: uncharacterized protein LOC104023607 [Nipponia nippon]
MGDNHLASRARELFHLKGQKECEKPQLREIPKSPWPCMDASSLTAGPSGKVQQAVPRIYLGKVCQLPAEPFLSAQAGTLSEPDRQLPKGGKRTRKKQPKKGGRLERGERQKKRLGSRQEIKGQKEVEADKRGQKRVEMEKKKKKEAKKGWKIDKGMGSHQKAETKKGWEVNKKAEDEKEWEAEQGKLVPLVWSRWALSGRAADPALVKYLLLQTEESQIFRLKPP